MNVEGTLDQVEPGRTRRIGGSLLVRRRVRVRRSSPRRRDGPVQCQGCGASVLPVPGPRVTGGRRGRWIRECRRGGCFWFHAVNKPLNHIETKSQFRCGCCDTYSSCKLSLRNFAIEQVDLPKPDAGHSRCTVKLDWPALGVITIRF